MIKRVSLLMFSALISHSTFANNGNIQSVIDAFTNCDNSFFYQLKTNANDFNEITNLVTQDDIAYIPVNSVIENEGNTNYFTKPILYRGLTITAYQNIAIKTPFLGQYYYWGFIIDGSVDSVRQSLKQLPWQQYNVASYVANPKLYDNLAKNSGWQPNPYIIDGIVPRLNTIEKSLYLEPINENQVHLVCSIQGDMNRDLLYSIHPDMKYIDQELDIERKAKAIKEQKSFEIEQKDNGATLDENQIDNNNQSSGNS
ncbi:hypothetical protein RHO13_11635 [Orbus wheelerorum]|uniref:hypothetical protein n=1 Tax=Orbus wheelerorum TaxID=3074111 RepID=UPI00370D6CC9